MPDKLQVMFFANGNSAVFRDGLQVTELQRSWLMKFVAFLEESGHEPEDLEITMPSGQRAVIEGTSWRIL